MGNISKEEFKEKLDSGEYILLDVRTQDEHDSKRIAESEVFDITQSDFMNKIERLDKNQKYLIYCKSGRKSNQALEIMKKLGFNKIYDLEGGILNYFA